MQRGLVWLLGAAILVILILCGIIIYLVSGKSSEEQAFDASMTRIQASFREGTSLMTLADSLVDARTKLELARPHMSQIQIDADEKELAYAEDAHSIWQNAVRYSNVCPEGCLDLYDPMHDLKMMGSKAEFEKWRHQHAGEWEDDSSRDEFISRILTATSLNITVCQKYPEHCGEDSGGK